MRQFVRQKRTTIVKVTLLPLLLPALTSLPPCFNSVVTWTALGGGPESRYAVMLSKYVSTWFAVLPLDFSLVLALSVFLWLFDYVSVSSCLSLSPWSCSLALSVPLSQALFLLPHSPLTSSSSYSSLTFLTLIFSSSPFLPFLPLTLPLPSSSPSSFPLKDESRENSPTHAYFFTSTLRPTSFPGHFPSSLSSFPHTLLHKGKSR